MNLWAYRVFKDAEMDFKGLMLYLDDEKSHKCLGSVLGSTLMGRGLLP